MGTWGRKGTDYLLKWLFLLPHWMSVGALVHGVPMILLSMTSIHDLTISPQNLKNMRIGLRKPTFLSSPGFRAW